MNLPNLTKDLAVIQKLSDLPNTTDGLSAAELKAKFDEAALFIQSWLNNSFIPAVKAENIPFSGNEQLNADNIQSAIQFVFDQVRGASSGTITNGSVTKEKLAAELLARVYGGLSWVSLNKPTANDNPATDFPIGQIWTRPHFSFENVASGLQWSETSDCTATVDGNKTTVTGTGGSILTTATMKLKGIGQAGDRICVLFDIKDKSNRIVTLNVIFNDVTTESANPNSAYLTSIAGSDLIVKFQAVFDDTITANGGSYIIENLTVVNIDKIMRQAYGAKEIADWVSYLRGLLPLKTHKSAREMYIQTDSGVWQQFDWETFPVDRGGTGVSKVSYGEMLFGTGSASMEKLTVPETEYSLMQFAEGRPQWRNPADVAASSGFARASEETYTGSGVSRAISFPGKPVVLWLRFDDKTHMFFQNTSMSGEYTGRKKVKFGTGVQEFSAKYTAGVTLEGNTLNFWFQQPELAEGEEWLEGDAVHFNEKDKQYTWTAIY